MNNSCYSIADLAFFCAIITNETVKSAKTSAILLSTALRRRRMTVSLDRMSRVVSLQLIVNRTYVRMKIGCYRRDKYFRDLETFPAQELVGDGILRKQVALHSRAVCRLFLQFSIAKRVKHSNGHLERPLGLC